jgi:hypothetical protein
MALRENQSIHIHKMVLITLKCFLLLLEYLYRIIILLILMFFFFCRNSGQQFRRGCRRCLSHSCFYLSRYFSFLCFFGICVSKYRHPMCSLCRSEHASTIILRTFLSARVMSCLRKKKLPFECCP